MEYRVRKKRARPCSFQPGDCRFRVNSDVPPLSAQCAGAQTCNISETHLNASASSPDCPGTTLYRTIHYDCIPGKLHTLLMTSCVLRRAITTRLRVSMRHLLEAMGSYLIYAFLCLYRSTNEGLIKLINDKRTSTLVLLPIHITRVCTEVFQSIIFSPCG